MANIFHDFSKAPTNLDIARSTFMRENEHLTTCNVGDLIPVYLDEMLPGDTFDLSTSMVTRLTTLSRPIFGNLMQDIFFFFVPNRLVWKHWEEFNGENNTSAWASSVSYSIPQLKYSYNTSVPFVGTLLDKFGLPNAAKLGTGLSVSVSALPFRAFAKIYNDWFRDQNVQSPYLEDDGDADRTAVLNDTSYTAILNGGVCPKVNKLHDYFTSCLPAPQKGDPVNISLGGTAPVHTANLTSYPSSVYNNIALRFVDAAGPMKSNVSGSLYLTQSYAGSYYYPASIKSGDTTSGSTGATPVPGNLVADLSDVSVVTVNALRTAFQIQKILERDARSGTRYVEILKSRFGVTCPDYRLQRPEYLGGHRVPIKIQQVCQTSSNENEPTPLADLGAYSHTSSNGHSFTYSATEHGYVIGVACIRQVHVYSQGINPLWSRKTLYDFYMPTLANIGEQPVLKKTIYADGSSNDDTVLGYQEAWADYRYKPSYVTGMLRTDLDASGLENWSIADKYSSAPSLTSSFFEETPDFLDRCLTVKHTVADQCIMDFYFSNKASRPMPVYSVPGLIDHH